MILLFALLPLAAAELESVSGTVEQVTRVETIGAEFEIDYLPSDDPGRVPEACAARLIGLPLMIDGEEVRQAARRPVPISVSDSAACP